MPQQFSRGGCKAYRAEPFVSGADAGYVYVFLYIQSWFRFFAVGALNGVAADCHPEDTLRALADAEAAAEAFAAEDLGVTVPDGDSFHRTYLDTGLASDAF